MDKVLELICNRICDRCEWILWGPWTLLEELTLCIIDIMSISKTYRRDYELLINILILY